MFFSGKVHELSEPYDIGDLPLDESSNLIIAKLPSTGNSHAEIDSNLKNNGKSALCSCDVELSILIKRFIVKSNTCSILQDVEFILEKAGSTCQIEMISISTNQHN